MPLTSYFLLSFVRVHRFRRRLLEPVGGSALGRPAAGGLGRLGRGLDGRPARGCGRRSSGGFTVGWLLAELEAAGKLLMLEADQENICL